MTTTVVTPTSALELLQAARAKVAKRWIAGDAADALLSMNGPYCAEACIYFTRANGQRIAQFEADYPSHADMLAALDKAIAVADAASREG